MSRSGYTDDSDDRWEMICWRGAVKSAIRGKRGQQFLREMLAALDALPEHKLIANDLEQEGAVCALGAVGKARSMDMSRIDPYEPEMVAASFGIAAALAQEVVYINDEHWPPETPESRYARVRRWVEAQIRAAE